MKKIILLLSCILTLQGCQTLSNVEPYIKPTAYLVGKMALDKSDNLEKDREKLFKVASSLKTVSVFMVDPLTAEDFRQIIGDATNFDKEWIILSSYLYDIYKDKLDSIRGNEKVAVAVKLVNQIADGLLDAAELSDNVK